MLATTATPKVGESHVVRVKIGGCPEHGLYRSGSRFCDRQTRRQPDGRFVVLFARA